LQFQGGFVAEECRLFTTKKKATLDSSSEGWVEIKDAYIEPENANTLQVFSLEDCGSGDDFNCVALKLVFNSTTDFYGRIILYKIEVYGEEIP
jgi:subtilase family serine protease